MNIQNEPSVIDLFSGAGGFSLGFRMAGFKEELALEIDKWASDTLRFNYPNLKVIQDDIRKYQASEEINTICSSKPDMIIGGPPCQGFSIAGPAQKDPKDPRNSLFIDYARWVEVLSPKVFIMENVKGLLSRNNASGERVIEIIKKTFENLGYSVEIWVLNAAEYGVPQVRERIFVVGNRLGIEKVGEPPKTHVLANGVKSNGNNGHNPQLSLFDTKELFKAITVWDAISDLPELGAGEGEEEQDYGKDPQTPFQTFIRGNQEILYNHVAMSHSARLVERFKHVGWGESSADVPEEHRARERNGNGKLSGKVYDQNNRRLNPHKQSHTIAASFYANFLHPYQHRNLTAREGARIQSFPDWYRFMGKKTVVSHRLLQREGRFEETHLCQYNQIGNAVPPLLAKAIADHIRKVCKL
jgi:DNA (cytosine-5)-methyltransferase 1